MLQINKTKLQGFYKLTRVRTIMEFYPLLVLFGLLGTKTYINFQSILVSISILLLLIGSFVINDIEDAEDDAKDPKKVKRNPISAGIIKKSEGYYFYTLINVLAILPLLLINYRVFAVGIAIFVVGYFYSCLPLRFKSRPLIDILSHGFFLAAAEILMFAFIANTSNFDTKTTLTIVGLYLFSMGGDLYNEIRDWVVDREVGLKNTASILGYNISRIVSYSFYGIGALLVTIASVMVVFRIG